uniref:E3 ubiquitin-protein ligase At3g02290-like n=1 Tax=Erigeron canadensis TaxID=72917 RepID=UPI001CB89BDB|nr:E3 ubiquitin-protein ligase At3g02290-like [Erigeron canadensis]XP_043632901.1 E3 ubiquitin-protein ligase At3g02290-like [Erigeron canadensis]
MGGVCCCLHYDCEDYVNPNSSVYRNCICLRCFLQNFLYMYTSLFQRGEEQTRLPSPSSIQGTASFSSSASLDNSLSGVYRSPPRPLPYDVDPRYIRLQRDGLVLRREKGSSRSQEEGESLRGSDSDTETDLLCAGSKWNSSTCEDGTKGLQTKYSTKLSTPKETSGFAHIFASSEDEDVCPTCLEEYTVENPKIITKCLHHYHLGCIYEWMERSERCPVCGKVMAFDEETV